MAKANHTACSVDGCNGEHAARGYCHKHYVQSKRGTVRKDATICAHCGAGFAAKNVAAMYCSKRCKHAAWLARHPEKHAEHRASALLRTKEAGPKRSCVAFNVCVTCSSQFVTRRKTLYCSEACRPYAVSAAQNKKEWAAKPCLVCGKPCGYALGMGRSKLYCSKECRHKSETFKDGRRASKARRRAIIKGATVETVKPFKVFDRDRWTCQLCGTKTPKGKRNTLSDDAPELDHIIPLSKGGDHSYMNTQCTCRKCNVAKSDKPLGQLLMFG